MIEEILEESGIESAETYFLQQPQGTFLTWGDTITVDGSDYDNEIYSHDVVFELFETPDAPDPAAHERLQAAMNAVPVRWTKEPRVWLQDVQLFMTTYTFSFQERRT